MKSRDVAFWNEAINDEMDSIMGNNTWVLVNLLLGCKPLGCKWIFKRKLKVLHERLGEADVILVIRVKHKSNVSTPMDTSEKLRPNNGQIVSQLKYSRVIGCLMYAMTCTRHNIAFVLATLAKAYRKMYNGKSRHLGVRHNMIRELIINRMVSIEFVRSQQNLVDHLMKDLTTELVIKSVEGMGLKSNLVAEC
ncbi:hypothetical protein Tco_1414199 [Tanacetum coccineum]